MASGVAAVALAAVLLGVAPLGADDWTPLDAARWVNLTGSLRADYFSSSRSLDDREHLFGSAFYLKASPRFGGHVSGVFEGWVRRPDLFDAHTTDGDLREGYLDLTLGKMDLRVGKQLIVWGRADRINPTDNLTPRDFTLLVPDDDDQRSGVPALKATLHVLGVSLTGVWPPVFKPNVVPFRATPGVTFHEVDPEGTAARDQWAVRLEQTGRLVDWSVSYFDGLDLFPDLALGALSIGPGGAPAVEVLLQHHRLHVFGADAATTRGRFGLRGEVAYTLTEDRRGDDPEVKNPYLFMVLGTDRTFLDDLNVNVQYSLRVVKDFQDPEQIDDPLRRALAIEQAVVSSQQDRVQHGVSVRISRKWLNDTLAAEVAAVYGFARQDFVVRPRLVYAFTDRITASVGADLFGGPRPSFFGRLRDASTAFAELKVSFSAGGAPPSARQTRTRGSNSLRCSSSAKRSVIPAM